jgi:hypothetical protein
MSGIEIILLFILGNPNSLSSTFVRNNMQRILYYMFDAFKPNSNANFNHVCMLLDNFYKHNSAQLLHCLTEMINLSEITAQTFILDFSSENVVSEHRGEFIYRDKPLLFQMLPYVYDSRVCNTLIAVLFYAKHPVVFKEFYTQIKDSGFMETLVQQLTSATSNR